MCVCVWRLCVGSPRGLVGRATALGGKQCKRVASSGTARELERTHISAVLRSKPFHCAIAIVSAS